MDNKVLHIEDEDAFEKLIDCSKEGVIVFVKYGASWCGPCKKIQPLYESLASKYTNCVFACVDSEELEDVCEFYNISSLPTFAMIKNGSYKELFKGANENMLVQIVQNENKTQ